MYTPQAQLSALVHGTTILVVDDDPSVRDATRWLLEDLGARILVAKDGTEALDRLEVESLDIVVTDLGMPRMDGYQFVQRLRRDPDWVIYPPSP